MPVVVAAVVAAMGVVWTALAVGPCIVIIIDAGRTVLVGVVTPPAAAMLGVVKWLWGEESEKGVEVVGVEVLE